MPAAWIFSLATLYGAIWLIADYRATALRPISVGVDRVLIQSGLRFSVRVPRSQITEVGCDKPEFGKQSLNLTFLATPTLWITLSNATTVQGPFGLRISVRAIGIKPDAAGDLEQALDSGVS